MDNSVIKKTGIYSGKKIAIFAGVHGNERAGVLALDRLINEVDIKKGEVYFIYGNPKAIDKNIRYIEKNLNRCFLSSIRGVNYEEKRAKELMKVLNECDVLLDLHASNNKNSTPFIICEENCVEVAKIFDFDIISHGWDFIEPGAADGYMFNQGKIGICLECGSVYESEQKKDLAYNSALQFLAYFGAIQDNISFSKRKKKVIKVFKVVKKITHNFQFSKDFYDFEKLNPGDVFAKDGDINYTANNNEYIIFPNSKNKIGDEAFVLATSLSDDFIV